MSYEDQIWILEVILAKSGLFGWLTRKRWCASGNEMLGVNNPLLLHHVSTVLGHQRRASSPFVMVQVVQVVFYCVVYLLYTSAGM